MVGDGGRGVHHACASLHQDVEEGGDEDASDVNRLGGSGDRPTAGVVLHTVGHCGWVWEGSSVCCFAVAGHHRDDAVGSVDLYGGLEDCIFSGADGSEVQTVQGGVEGGDGLWWVMKG